VLADRRVERVDRGDAHALRRRGDHRQARLQDVRLDHEHRIDLPLHRLKALRMSAAESIPTSTISKAVLRRRSAHLLHVRRVVVLARVVGNAETLGVRQQLAHERERRVEVRVQRRAGMRVRALVPARNDLRDHRIDHDMNTIGIDLSVTTRIDDCATGVVTATIIAGFLPCAFVSSWGISVRSKLMCWSSNATSLPSTKPWRTTSALKPFTAARSAGARRSWRWRSASAAPAQRNEASSAMKARAARSDMKRLPSDEAPDHTYTSDA
jgi:hypothetical protein